ncbi:MAG: methionine--tRNA ligase [Terriglobia bacterium]|jgi:methionyl-tRNA synthetase
MPTFYLTTPIYYPNARPHVGSAYTTIVCDVLARYKRMCGYDVAFLTGTDEHGEKLERAAAAAGQSPSQFVAEKRKLFVQLWGKLGIPVTVYPEGKPDSLRFIYTTHPDHDRSVQRLLVRARERGFVDKRRYEGRYCVSDERYISEGADPVNCDICGRPAELISEENYFFKLSAFQDRLLELYDKHPEFVQPEYRRNEVKSFVKSGLRDISVSRKRLKWGIPWPDDPEQVFYVWYDALTSYMTGIGYAQGENGSAEFQKYWHNKPGESEVVHMIGKDILRFHAVYWPAFIMAAYPNQPEMLPTTVFAHGWIYYEQDKMSKSKGNVVYSEPIIDALDSFGAPGNDALRYYLLREAPFGQDTSFSYGGLIQRYNSDLANDLGNLANRTITMINSYLEGLVPPRPEAPLEDDAMLEIDTTRDLEREAANILEEYQTHLNAFDFSRGLEAAWRLVGLVNEYLVYKEPWVIGRQLDLSKGHYVTEKRSKQQLNPILYTSAEAVRISAVLLYPVLPHAAERIWKQLGCDQYSGRIEDQRMDELKWGGLKPDTKVGKAEPIFPRLDKAATLAKLDEFAEADRNRDKPKEAFIPVQTEKKPEAAPATAPEHQIPSPQAPGPSPQPPTPSPALISIEDFAKVDMRVGEVKAAERVPGASKLLKLMVDIGTEVRQLVAGLAEYYQPENLIGMKVVVVTNLQPRKLRGVESNGMIVAASAGERGRPVLVTFKEEVANGARLK